MYPRAANVFATAAWAIVAIHGRLIQSDAAQDCEQVTGSFYLTGVPANSSTTFPIFTALESRGVRTLSSATSYFDQWTYNRSIQRHISHMLKEFDINNDIQGLTPGYTSRARLSATPRSAQAMRSSLGPAGTIMGSRTVTTACFLWLRTSLVRCILS